MATQRQGVREIRLVFETDPGNFARSDTHIMDRITWALAQVQNVHIGVAFFDENGNRIRKVELHEASPDMVRIMETELSAAEPEDEGVSAVVA